MFRGNHYEAVGSNNRSVSQILAIVVTLSIGAAVGFVSSLESTTSLVSSGSTAVRPMVQTAMRMPVPGRTSGLPNHSFDTVPSRIQDTGTGSQGVEGVAMPASTRSPTIVSLSLVLFTLVGVVAALWHIIRQPLATPLDPLDLVCRRLKAPTDRLSAGDGMEYAMMAVSGPKVAAPAGASRILRLSPEQLATGGIDPGAEPPEGMRAFGEMMRAEFMAVDLQSPDLRVLNVDPPVLAVRDFLSAEECDALVDAARVSDELRQSAVGGAGGENIRTSRTLTLTSGRLQAHPTRAAILRRVARLLPEIEGLHADKRAFRAPRAKGEWAFELPQVAHYRGGQHFLSHEDAFPAEAAARKGYQRRATVLVYLNDVAEGGATYFDHIQLAVRPRKGDALVFFPANRAGLPDHRTLHTAQQAVAGHEKWVSQTWIAGGTGNAAAKRAPKQQAPKRGFGKR